MIDAVTYREKAVPPKVHKVSFSHLSVEVGHLYMHEFVDGETARRQFAQVAPWVQLARQTVLHGASDPRVSTCFLIDDYFSLRTGPKDVVPMLLDTAREYGVPIDYIVREAACAVGDGVPLAAITASRLLPEPTRGANGSRPPAQESGWVCNGERSSDSGPVQAMHPTSWKPPEEHGKRRHSTFIDVEMWNEREDLVNGRPVPQRIWSCPFLAAVWHLLRLGMLLVNGAPAVCPTPWPAGRAWPEHWNQLPAVAQISRHAHPFAAYRSVSVLSKQYLHIEHASRVILDHLRPDVAMTEQVVRLARLEGIEVSDLVTDRMAHLFLEGV